MSIDEAIEFILAKYALLIEHVSTPAQKAQLTQEVSALDRLWSHPRLSMGQLRSLDGEGLELRMKHLVSAADTAVIRGKLVARFKTSRLRASDRAVVRRVLKRGAIADLEEYYQVKEFVSCVDNSDVVGEENYGILDSLAETFDAPDEDLAELPPAPAPSAATSRRRPPPPFDHTLEPDEKLCPPDTALETRVEFVRAKFALVMARTSFPQDCAVLEHQLKGGLGIALGAQTPVEQRGHALEFLEHEAEFFAGYGVSGAQHRAIADELEQRFGFRRLGLSAQSRLARVLATSDALGWRDRLMVERFIYCYPHQTLFTREEIQRAAALLKKPSPSQPPPAPTLPPRPKIPPDLSLLSVGAVFKVKHDDRPHRVVMFDSIEVFYDVDWGADVGWGLLYLRSARVCYYRMPAPLFLDGAEKLRVDELTPEFLALHRPGLPLRFGRSERLQWLDSPLSSREEFEQHVKKVAPELLDEPPLDLARVALLPRSVNGAFRPAVLVTAANGKSLTMIEVHWHAHQLQRPLKAAPTGGVGFFRSGLAKRGTPAYFIDGSEDPGGALRWLREAPPAP